MDRSAEQMVATDDGVRLRTWTSGSPSGLPAVVLLHGGPGMWDYLEPLAAMLDDLTVVRRYDQRGCGGSEASDDYGFARYVADLDGLRRTWGHDRWLVLGHSFGASLALAYADTHPDRTAGLCYLSGVGIGDWRSGYAAEQHARTTPEQRARLAELEALPERGAAQEAEWRTLQWFTDHADPEAGWAFAQEAAAVPWPVNWEANRALHIDSCGPFDDVARRVVRRTPTRFVHGVRDPRPIGAVRDLAAAAGEPVHAIEYAGHQPWLERPAELRALLRSWVAGVPGDPLRGAPGPP